MGRSSLPGVGRCESSPARCSRARRSLARLEARRVIDSVLVSPAGFVLICSLVHTVSVFRVFTWAPPGGIRLGPLNFSIVPDCVLPGQRVNSCQRVLHSCGKIRRVFHNRGERGLPPHLRGFEPISCAVNFARCESGIFSGENSPRCVWGGFLPQALRELILSPRCELVAHSGLNARVSTLLHNLFDSRAENAVPSEVIVAETSSRTLVAR